MNEPPKSSFETEKFARRTIREMALKGKFKLQKPLHFFGVAIGTRIENTTHKLLTDNKAGYTATPVACGWAGAVFEVTWSFGQEQ